MIKRPAFLGLCLVLIGTQARAERQVSAFDPKVHLRPPTMRAIDGHPAELVIDEEFLEAAERSRGQRPNQAPAAVPAGIGNLGEVIVVQGNTDDLLVTDGSGYGLQRNGLQSLVKKVIAAFGDNFHAVTIWMTFDDRSSPMAEAYEVPVKNEVEGLGSLPVMDESAAYGSNGVLRSVLNMKLVGFHAGETPESWQTGLETWGQESSHRWLVFMSFRDPRTGKASDALLGRQCSHYSRFVDTQASIHDGYAWQDNGDGTFTWTEANKRYGNLDLYGMGLMAADEVPPFFLIDGIRDYSYPQSCQNYQYRSTPRQITGTRVDITIEDIIAANGERKVPGDERQDYWREAEVILTSPAESLDSPRVQMLARRLEKGRAYWEAWNRQASRQRLVMCTKTSADCGDARSDVGTMIFNAAGKAPQAEPLVLEVPIVNSGTLAATGVKVTFEVEARSGDAAAALTETKDLGILDPGATRTQSFALDLKGVPCGTEIAIKASSQSDVHHSRAKETFLLGAQEALTDGFEKESGWTVNPDGNDTMSGAQWERGKPDASVLLRQAVQPAGAHGGANAWVTGLSATPQGARATLVREGKAVLQSPLFDTNGLRDPLLRYWVSFAGVRAAGSGLEPSDLSRLLVQARASDPSGDASSGAGPWVDVDSLSGEIAASWRRRSIKLPKEVLTKSQVQLRFVAEDANPASGGVEAAIDDVSITSNVAGCHQSALVPMSDGGSVGCGCRIGAAPRPSALVMLSLACASFALRGRRRR